MLTEIRDRSSGVFAWVIAGLIIIPMAFFGVNQYASTEARPTIVEIGDQKITQQDFQANLVAEQNNARERNPELANSGVLNSEFFKKQVLDNMLNRALTDYIASENNYQVGEKQVDKIIRDTPNFQTEGKFDQSLYDAFAASRGRAGSAQIKADIRSSTRSQQVVSGYQESALVLPNEVRELLEIQAEQRGFDLITVKQADFNSQVSVSDEDINAYYQANIEQFMLPDRMSVSYIELDKAQISQSLTVEESRIQQLYDEYAESFVADETRKTRHILLNTGGDQDDDEQLAKANELVQQLADGADFAELAKQHSQDPGSAANGGSLGDVERGQMVVEFDEATFSMEEGVVSEPVKTQFGYHIIQVEKIQATEAEPFSLLSVELEQEERERMADELIVEQAEQLRNALFEQSESLDGAAQALSLTVRTTDLFSRDEGIGVADNEAVRAAAFSEAVKDDDVNSELIEIADGVFVAVRKLDFAASEPKKLEAVSAQIKDSLTTERAIAAAKAAGDSLLERAQSDWASLAADETVVMESHTVTMIDTQPKVPGDVLREVIRMRLDNGDATVNSFTGANGDFNIVRLTKIAPGNLANVSSQIKDATRRLIEQRNGQSMYTSYIEGLKKDLNLEINEDLL